MKRIFVQILLATAFLNQWQNLAFADYKCQSFSTDFATPGQRVGLWIMETLGQESFVWQFKRLKGAEKEALGMDAQAAWALSRARKRAEEFRLPTCDYGNSDGALDAVRHFVLSATLASIVGRARAMELLDAHEAHMTKDPTDLPSSFMDLHNNAVGGEYGSRYFKSASYSEKLVQEKGPMSDDALILALAQAFRNHQLKMIKKPDQMQSSLSGCEDLFKREAQILRDRR